MTYLRSLFSAGAIIFLLCIKLNAQDYSSNIVSGYEERKGKNIAALKNYTRQDTARVNALIEVIATALIRKQRQELLPYCEQALLLSRKLNYPEGLGRCYIWMGYMYKAALDRTAAHLYFDSAILLANDNANEMLMKYYADGHRGKAWIYYDQENFHKSLKHFFEALKYYEIHDSKIAMHLYTMISDIYSRVNNYQQAIVYADKNIALAEKDSSRAWKAQAYLSLVEIYVHTNELEQATVYLDKMKPYMPDPVEHVLNSSYYMNRGQIHYLQQQYDSAFFYYKEAYNITRGSMHSVNKTGSLYFLSKSAMKLGKPDLAKKYADENLAVAEKTHAKIGKINALLNLSDYYHKKNDNSKAYDLLQEAAVLKDSLLLEANINQINTLAAVYESDKKEKEILQLQNEREIQAAAVKQKSTLNKVFIASILVLLIFGYLGYINFKKGQQLARHLQAIQKQKIVELEKDKQLSTINAMLKGQEEERSRIAKDLHDGLGSLLSGTKLSFINVKENILLSPENSSMFDKSLSMLDNTIGDLRKVAQNLMPEALVKFGLNEALRDFCDSIQTSTGIKILYQQFGEKRKPDNTAEVFTFRIIQELVNNAIKHAGASEVIVQLTMSNDKIGIAVEDNGRGFDKERLAIIKGAGLGNINYRVQYFSGTSDIVTSPGNGTSVNIELIA